APSYPEVTPMPTMPDPGHAGQVSDPPEPRTRSAALRLSAEEARHVRTAILRIARAKGGFIPLALAIGIPTNTLYHAARPRSRPSPGLAIRLAAVAKVPVEVLLGGKVVVAPVVIGVAA